MDSSTPASPPPAPPSWRVLVPPHQKADYLIAVILTLCTLAVYTRTLAPDILYSDSAEFQCLAYTFGVTHSTGYPTYLLLGKLVGLLPFGTPAWRVNLLSAISAAVAIGGIFLLIRYFTRSRAGAILASLALAISYTFWSQAIIAEVYTPALAFLVIILILLLHWQGSPTRHNLALFTAALLAGIGFGVHASVWLIYFPAALFVLGILWKSRLPRPTLIRTLVHAAAGATLGFSIFIAAFLISDSINHPTSFINTTLYPSRPFWNLDNADFATPYQRIKMTVISAQWGNALFPGGDFSYTAEWNAFTNRLLHLEFSPLLILLAFAGLAVMFSHRPASGAFLLLYFVVAQFFILNYRVGDKFVFYLPLYLPIVISAGAAMGYLLDLLQQRVQPLLGKTYHLLYLLQVIFLLTLILLPVARSRWSALKTGNASFVTDEYVFPVNNLMEPRLFAERTLAGAPSDAVFVLDWRGLYSVAYVAQVEREMKNTLFFEAMPYGNNGTIASTLVTQLTEYLQQGRPVYVQFKYPGLEQHFRMLPSLGNLYKLSLRQ